MWVWNWSFTRKEKTDTAGFQKWSADEHIWTDGAEHKSELDETK
jgi:hypothetical protein